MLLPLVLVLHGVDHSLVEVDHTHNKSVDTLHTDTWGFLEDRLNKVLHQFFCTGWTHLVDTDKVLHRVDVVDVSHTKYATVLIMAHV